MRTLHALLVAKGISPSRLKRNDRNMGHFSYAVPEFTWEHLPVHRWQTVDCVGFGGKYDLIFQEDGTWARYENRDVPVAYYVWDSTLSDGCHYEPRFDHAKEMGLVLVDHDRLERFAGTGRPVRRLSYCVNDKLYRDYGLEKTLDVAYHMNIGGASVGAERAQLRGILRKHCHNRGYSFSQERPAGRAYAESFNRARIVANWPRQPGNRPFRLLDGMACRSCVVTGPVPDVSGEVREAGVHYVEVRTLDEFCQAVDELLASGRWREVAESGYRLVRERHTWAVRARELRRILNEELGL